MTAAKKSGASAARSVLMALLSALVGALLAACSLPTTPTIGSSIDINFDLSAESVLKINFAGNDAAKVKLLNVPAGQLYMAKANVSGASSRFITPSGSVISFGPADGTLTVGSSTRNFWVQTTGQTTWTQETATLRAATNVAYIWVANSNYSDLSSLSNDNLLKQQQIKDLGDKFGTDPTIGNGIRALVSNIFSTENGGEVGGDGGIDGDQHIQIFIYDIDGDYTSTQSSGMVGYFWAKDEYSDLSVAPTYRSNEAELFYLDAYFADLDADLSTSTLAHEYQHMIQFNQKKLLRNVEASTWFDEMCSMASEDFVGQTLGIPDSASPRSRISQFKSSYYQAGVTEWLTGSDVLKSYASLYVFGAYLSRNFGGASLFHNLVVSSQVDQAAISAALQTLSTGTTFDAAFRDYNSTFVFGNPAPTGAYSFPAKASLYNGVTYNLPAFALSDYSPGLSVFSPGGQVSLRPYGHSIPWDFLLGQSGRGHGDHGA